MGLDMYLTAKKRISKYNPDKFSNNDIITFKYCTNPRIDKIIFKLLDEDFKLEMALMKQLPNRVYNDIMAEHWEDIVKSRWVVDFGSLKKMITRRCLSVLKQVIVNNALEVIK